MKQVFSALAFAVAGVTAIVGDEVPNPTPVVNVLVEEPAFGYSDAVKAASYQAREAKLAQLQSMAGASFGGAAARVRANAAKLSKMSSYLKENAPKLDAEAVRTIEQQLSGDCGESCVKFFHEFVRKMEGKDSANWQPALVDMMKTEYKRVNNQYKENLQTSRLAQSFVKKNKAKFNLVDVPCADTASCKLVEVIANKCEYGRVATMATYNAVNLAVHVFSVVINVLCGCVHVGPMSRCILANKGLPAPICDFPYSTYVGLFKANQQIWESGVKGTTKACSTIGDFRVASL